MDTSRCAALIEAIRPDLARYCARMMGSAADGEDIVQDTLARAMDEIAELDDPAAMRAWLFRVAHNRALDVLRRYDRRMGGALDGVEPVAEDDAAPDAALLREEVLRTALSRFLELAPAQRSVVILKDVLGASLEEIAALTQLTVPAVKAALHRGRARLHELAATPPVVSPVVARYAALFNARDWDGVRALLAEDVKLDLVSRMKRSGRRDVGVYFTNYASKDDWSVAAGWQDGREGLVVTRRDGRSYFVELVARDGAIAEIIDSRYA